MAAVDMFVLGMKKLRKTTFLKPTLWHLTGLYDDIISYRAYSQLFNVWKLARYWEQTYNL